MSGRLGDHNLPGVHAFWEVLGKNPHLFIYQGGFRLRMKITNEKGMFAGRIQDSSREGMPSLYTVSEKPWEIKPDLVHSAPASSHHWLLETSIFELLLMVSVQKSNFKWCKTNFFNWTIFSQTSLIEVGPDQSQQDQVQETNASTFREVGKKLCNILPSNYCCDIG